MTGWRALLLGIALAPWSPARAQDWAIEVAMASDPERAGPVALQWLREEVLPALPGWPHGLPTMGPLCVRFTATAVAAWPSSLAGEGDYLVGALRSGQRTALLLRCAFDGTEDWYAVDPEAMDARLKRLVRLLNPRAAEPSGRVDVAALVGNLIRDDRTPGHRGLLLSLGPGYCGNVVWRAWQGDRGLRVRGHSGGGLLFPAVLALLAAERGGESSIGAAAPSDPVEPWRILAASARDGERAEAARQLARCRSPASVATLRSLLHADDRSRAVAIDSLVRQRSVESLSEIVAAASSDLPESVEMARVALQTLWPMVPPTARAGLVDELRRHPVAEIRELDPIRAGAIAQDSLAASPRTGSLRSRILAGLLVLSVFFLGLWLRERVRGETQESADNG